METGQEAGFIENRQALQGKMTSIETYVSQPVFWLTSFVGHTPFEQIAVDAAQALTQGTIEQVLRQDTRRLGPAQPCPQGGRACPVATEPRDLVVRGATVHYDEPVG